MPRRKGGSRGRRIPGLAVALAARWNEFAEHWDAPDYAASAADVLAGVPVTVTGREVWRAVFDARHPDEHEDLRVDRTVYVVTGDVMVPVEQ